MIFRNKEDNKVLKNYVIIIASFFACISCSRPGSNVAEQDNLPDIFPDYCGVTVPVNIAPLNFRLTSSPEMIYAILEGNKRKVEVSGKHRISIPQRKWRNLIQDCQEDSLDVTVYSRNGNNWTRFKSFAIHIKKEKIDPWLVYRLIAPGYEAWSEMGIYQRDLTSFRSSVIINNRLLPGACMNCHSFSAHSPDNMVFHLRGDMGATMLIQDGSVTKLNTRTENTISNCVYPYWHPSGKFIAFSVNNISQVFHSRQEKRIEVIDSKSDIVVYNISENKLITSKIISSEGSLETFPVFSPDGNSLIFCSAVKKNLPEDFDKVRYSLCRIAFDPEVGSFGERIDTLISSFSTCKSISFPRVSPDGKYLVFTLSGYGNFSIWHRDADLYQLDMNTGDHYPAEAVNSDEAESYHSWASNSRWMVFTSRRTDGLYSRPFISYLDESGRFRKPFMVPQKDPDQYDKSLMSYNIPEFLTGRIELGGRRMLRSIGSNPKSVNFELEN